MSGVYLGYPASVTQTRLQFQVGSIKSSLDEARVESVTGRRADLVGSLGSQIGKVHRIEKQIADNEAHIQQIALLRADFTVVQENLTAFRETANLFATEIEAALGVDDQIAIEALTANIDAETRRIFGQLNSEAVGRYLFSGAATETPPVTEAQTMISAATGMVVVNSTYSDIDDALDVYFDTGVTAGSYTFDIYQGSTLNAPTREISDSRRLGVDIRADDQAFRDLFRGYSMFVGSAQQTDPALQKEVREKAAEYIRKGSEALTAIQTRLGANEEIITVTEARLTAERTTMQLLLADMVTVDQFEAASITQNLEIQLEAIYLTTARISQLSLVNFLR